MKTIINVSAVFGVVGMIGFAEQSLSLAVVSAIITLPYIVMKANQPLEEEM